MSGRILDRILAAENLPSVPMVAIRVLELTENEDVAVGEIASVVEQDPALTARILRTANSSLFGLSKAVGSVQQATVVLGLRTVKVMALSFSLVDSIDGSTGRDFDYDRYWRRSLSTAVMAKLIADASPGASARRDEAFVGGLLCDIGMMAAHRAVPDLYAEVGRRYAAEPRPIQEIEQAVLGVTHATISAELLKRWNLPDMLNVAVAAHHDDDLGRLTDRTQVLAGTLFAASAVAGLFCEDVPSATLDPVIERCAAVTGLAPDGFAGLLPRLDTHLKEAASLFSIEIGECVSYQELRDRAVVQLAAISVSAERERVEARHREQQAKSELQVLNSRAEDLERQAATDALTRIANRAAFEERLSQAVERAEQTKGSVGLIMLDLDHFKKLNDTYGHQAGDEALRRVGEVLREVSEGPRLAARYGGEEFAVIVADATARIMHDLAEEIRQRIEALHVEHNGHPFSFTASLGVTHVRYDYEVASGKEIIERADECLYDAKRGGRNRVEITF